MSDLEKEWASAKPLPLDEEWESAKPIDTVKDESPRPPPAAPNPSLLSSVVRGVGHGVSAGFDDKLRGVAAGLGEAYQSQKDNPIAPEYVKASYPKDGSFSEKVKWLLSEPKQAPAMAEREAQVQDAADLGADQARAETAEAVKAHPIGYGAGDVAGTIALTAVPGLGGLAGIAPKGAMRGARLAQAAKSGAALGGLRGAGESEGETAGEIAKDALAGGTVGAGSGILGQGIGEGLGSAFRQLGPYLTKLAGEKAIKAIGGIAGDIRSGLSRNGPVGGLPRVQQAGNDLRELGVATTFVTPSKALDRIKAEQEIVGGTLGKILPDLDDKLAAKGVPSAVNLQDVLDAVQQRVIEPLRKSGVLDQQAAADAVERQALQLAELAPAGQMTLGQAHEFRRALDKSLFWQGKNPFTRTISSEALGDMRQVFNDSMTDAIEKAGAIVGEPKGQQWSLLNRLYSSLAIGEKMAERGAIRGAGNNSVGLTDALMGVAGAVAGGHTSPTLAGALGAGTLLGSKLLRTYGPGMQSTAAGLASRIGQSPIAIANRSGSASKALGLEAYTESTSQEHSLSPMTALARTATRVPEIQKAGQEGGKPGMAAAHYLKSQTDQEYRQIHQALSKEKKP